MTPQNRCPNPLRCVIPRAPPTLRLCFNPNLLLGVELRVASPLRSGEVVIKYETTVHGRGWRIQLTEIDVDAPVFCHVIGVEPHVFIALSPGVFAIELTMRWRTLLGVPFIQFAKVDLKVVPVWRRRSRHVVDPVSGALHEISPIRWYGLSEEEIVMADGAWPARL